MTIKDARSVSNQPSNYGGVQTWTTRPAAVLVDAQSALIAVRRACFGTKRSQVQILSPRPVNGLIKGTLPPLPTAMQAG